MSWVLVGFTSFLFWTKWLKGNSLQKIKKKFLFKASKESKATGVEEKGETMDFSLFIYFLSSFHCRANPGSFTHNMLKWIHWKKRNYLTWNREWGSWGDICGKCNWTFRYGVQIKFSFHPFLKFEMSKLSGVKRGCFIFFMVFLPGFVDGHTSTGLYIYTP